MTIVGGSRTDVISAIAVDADGNSYIAGSTRSPDLPIVNGFDATCGGDAQCESYTDAFVMKLSPDGAILYATYLGGSGGHADDDAGGIAVGAPGVLYLAGMTGLGRIGRRACGLPDCAFSLEHDARGQSRRLRREAHHRRRPAPQSSPPLTELVPGQGHDVQQQGETHHPTGVRLPDLPGH